jgi:hypothetical protein
MKIECPHGNALYTDQVVNGHRQVHGGIPKCCLELLLEPAAGSEFIIVQRDGRQKRIRRGTLGPASLVDAGEPREGKTISIPKRIGQDAAAKQALWDLADRLERDYDGKGLPKDVGARPIAYAIRVVQRELAEAIADRIEEENGVLALRAELKKAKGKNKRLVLALQKADVFVGKAWERETTAADCIVMGEMIQETLASVGIKSGLV